MSLVAMLWAFEQPAKAVPPVPRLVLLSLAEHADGGCVCRPSLPRLELRTGLSRRAIQQAIAHLVAAGVVSIESRGNGRVSTHYRVLLEATAVVPAPPPRRPRKASQPNLPDLVRRSGREKVAPLRGAPAAPLGCISDTPGVHVLHPSGAPAAPQGCTSDTAGVHVVHTRGASAAPEPVIEPSIEPSKGPGASRRAPEVSLPVGWQPSPAGESFATERGYAVADLLPAFEAHHRSRDTRFRSWDAAWRTWVLNQVQFDARRGLRTGGGGRSSVVDAVALLMGRG